MYPLRPLAIAILPFLLLAGCNGEIYLRDGVTDGDTFYLAEKALTDDDPAVQSWVSYSLTLSACKLLMGGDNPARASSFDCELTARRHLVKTWSELRAEQRNDYLDTLLLVEKSGWLAEYVAANFKRQNWVVPASLDRAGFREFAAGNLHRHQPVTRIIGSWNYSRNVNAARQPASR